MQNLHIIKVKYLGASNTLGSRIKLTSLRFNQSVTMSYDYAYNNAVDKAVDYLLTNGHAVIGTGEGGDCYYAICEPNADNSFTELRIDK